MLGPMGVRIIDLLKVMTPGEIDRYVNDEAAPVEAKLDLAAGAEEFDVAKSPQPPIQSAKDKSDSPEEESEENIEHQAKIIPLHKNMPEQQEGSDQGDQPADQNNESIAYQLSDEDQEAIESTSELESAGIMSAGKIAALKRKKINELKSKQESTTSFILNQREKLKKTKLKLIEQDAIKNYSQNSNVETLNDEIDIDNPDEEAAVGSKGILVNKRHY